MAILAAFMVPHPPLIVPDIGRGEEKRLKEIHFNLPDLSACQGRQRGAKLQKTIDAYQEIAHRIAKLNPETIVLLSPHQVMYADYFHISPGRGAVGDFGQFRAGEVKLEVSYDTEFVEKLCELADKENLPAGTAGERDSSLDHGTMVPLYFVNQYFKEYQLVRIGLSGLPLIKHYELGQCIKAAAEILNRSVVLIASGDLSHRLKADGPYGYQKEGPEYDSRIMEVMGKGNFLELFSFSENFCEKAGECGHRSFTIMAGALDRTKVTAECLSYEGPFGVGYGVCSYLTCGSTGERNFKEQYEEAERQQVLRQREQEDAYVKLARTTIEAYIGMGEKIGVPEGLPEEMYVKRAGVFVCIKKKGSLRGCIGTIQAVQSSIAEEIIANAISAAVKDPRFSPIEPDELDELFISVDVLGDIEKIDSLNQLDVQRYGVIVTRGYKRGLLLPNLEGVDTIEEQIAIAKQKAGIGEEEEVQLERFEVVRH